MNINNYHQAIIIMIVKNILLFTVISLFLFIAVNKAYSQEESSNNNIEITCDKSKYLIDLPNIKIIDLIIGNSILNDYCFYNIDNLIYQGFTIKGILQDRFIILEKTY